MTMINELRRAIIEAAGRAVAAEDFPPVPLSDYSLSENSDGSFSTTLAETWSTEMNMSAQDIARIIKKHIFLLDTDFAECMIEQNGMLTFILL